VPPGANRGTQFLALVLVLLGGCSTATDTVDHSRAAVPLSASTPGEPPSLLPLWKFFGNRETNWGYKISPDGARVGWIGSHKSRMTVFVRTVGERDPASSTRIRRARSSVSTGRLTAAVSFTPRTGTATSATTST